jgi:hypothetical protein
VVQGVLPIDPVEYEENRDHFLQHQWIPPGWPWVDPQKEVQADILAIESGLTTQTESLASRGRDFDETLQQIEREQRAKADMEARMMAYRADLELDQPDAPNDPNDDEQDSGADYEHRLPRWPSRRSTQALISNRRQECVQKQGRALSGDVSTSEAERLSALPGHET